MVGELTGQPASSQENVLTSDRHESCTLSGNTPAQSEQHSGQAQAVVNSPDSAWNVTGDMTDTPPDVSELNNIAQRLCTGMSESVKPVPDLRGGKTDYLRDIDFKWLNGRGSERAVFWFWVYIRKTMARIIQPRQSELNPGWTILPGFLYFSLNLPKNTTSTDERRQIIIRYFKNLSVAYPLIQVKELFNFIRDIWLNFHSPVKEISWIKRNDSKAIEWAWDYLSKKSGIKESTISWFKFADLNEKYIAIMGIIDCQEIFEDTTYSKKEDIISKKNALLKRMENAFRQRERRSRNAGDDISRQSQKKLQALAKIQGKKSNQLLEKLIDDEYLRYKSHPEVYKISGRSKK